MNWGIIVTGIVGLVTTIGSSYITWFLARKKYYTEVDHNMIKNMEDSLEFYKKLSDDNKVRLNSVLEKNKELEEELKELRRQVLNLTMNICLDFACKERYNMYNKLCSHEETEQEKIDKSEEGDFE